MEVEAKTLTACNLDQKLVFLEGIEGAIFVVVYASAESAIDNRFLQSLKKNTTFSSSLATCVLDDSHTVETWTGDVGQLQWEMRNGKGPHTIKAANIYKRSRQPKTLTKM